jgi:hypothetical protein
MAGRVGYRSFRSAYAVFRGDYCLPPTASASRLRLALARLHDTAARGPSDHRTRAAQAAQTGSWAAFRPLLRLPCSQVPVTTY